MSAPVPGGISILTATLSPPTIVAKSYKGNTDTATCRRLSFFPVPVLEQAKIKNMKAVSMSFVLYVDNKGIPFFKLFDGRGRLRSIFTPPAKQFPGYPPCSSLSDFP